MKPPINPEPDGTYPYSGASYSGASYSGEDIDAGRAEVDDDWVGKYISANGAERDISHSP